MSQFIIENFSNGLDLRKQANTSPPGSLRVLNNCFVNDGGEIEKRKAFVKHAALTAYAQSYAGLVSGPHPVASREDTVFFRHRHDSLPSGGGWTAGSGSVAKSLDFSWNSARTLTAWAMKSTISTSPDDINLLRGSSLAQFADHSHLFEAFINQSLQNRVQHIDVTHAANGEPTAEAAVTANANRSGILTLKSKGYVVAGNTLYASVVDNPGDMSGTGSGSVDLRVQGVPIGRAVALTEYFGQLVIFGMRGAQFWEVDPDFAQNQYLRTIPLSLFAFDTVTPYLYGDVLYLTAGGVRSLRAQDSSNVAHVTDVGSPIDDLLKTALSFETAVVEDLSETENAEKNNATLYSDFATAAVHLETGQFWLCLKDKVYVLSVHQDAKVRAWSTFDLPASSSELAKYTWVADICAIRRDLMFRNFDDEIYVYGGLSGSQYDSSLAEVITPYMDMGRPSSEKQIHSIDIACEGTWEVAMSTDIRNESWETIGTVGGSTHTLCDMLPADLWVTHFALRLRSTTASAAKIGQISVVYTGGDEK